MGWLKIRLARRKLIKKAGLSPEAAESMIAQLTIGKRVADSVYENLKEQETPEYDELLDDVNTVLSGTMEISRKCFIALHLIEEAKNVTDALKLDLTKQVEEFYDNKKRSNG